ncbi:MAG: sensor histidine kinase [Omnitrophica WOR_2 bacterium]
MEQIELLEYLSAEMSSSLSLAVQRKERDDERLNQSMHTFQLDIARDLHDTIGQNISYLRMKLEKLSEANQFARTDKEKDINHMYEVVNESYDLIRGMLSVLQSTRSISLVQLFTRYADQVTERSMINISFSSHGIPKTLTPGEIRHLFYIFREAISNIEKHSHASQVSVELDWHEEILDMVISDDGCGFDQAQISAINHYGLTFMRDRAQYLKGTFSILSKINQGTKITVQVPCV